MCGIMYACVYYQSTQEKVVRAGSLFIWVSQRWLEQFEDVKFQSLRGANARKVVLVVGIMAAHALGEGSGVGVSFCGQRGWSQVCPANSTHLPYLQRVLALACINNPALGLHAHWDAAIAAIALGWLPDTERMPVCGAVPALAALVMGNLLAGPAGDGGYRAAQCA